MAIQMSADDGRADRSWIAMIFVGLFAFGAVLLRAV
jgi:hypothetical protein